MSAVVTREVRATVASLRVDSVAAAGFGMSRSKAACDIDLAKLTLNGKAVTQPSQAVKVGDELTHANRGRLVLDAVTGTTKKQRLGILLTRFYNLTDNEREGLQPC